MYTLPRTFLLLGGKMVYLLTLRKVQSNHTSLQNGPSETTHVVLPHVELSRLACVIKRTVRQMELWLCRLGHKWLCGFHLLLWVPWSGWQDTEMARGEDYMEMSQDLQATAAPTCRVMRSSC